MPGAIHRTLALRAGWQVNRQVWARGGEDHITQPLRMDAGVHDAIWRRVAAVCRRRFLAYCRNWDG